MPHKLAAAHEYILNSLKMTHDQAARLCYVSITFKLEAVKAAVFVVAFRQWALGSLASATSRRQGMQQQPVGT